MRKLGLLLLTPLALAGLFGGCGDKQEDAASGSPLTGVVRVDGSSTVFPITEAVGEEFQRLHGGVRVTVGISGTGGGFKRFVGGETDINDASRPIKPARRPQPPSTASAPSSCRWPSTASPSW